MVYFTSRMTNPWLLASASGCHQQQCEMHVVKERKVTCTIQLHSYNCHAYERGHQSYGMDLYVLNKSVISQAASPLLDCEGGQAIIFEAVFFCEPTNPFETAR